MKPGFDDDEQRMIHEQAVASMQAAGEASQICLVLGQVRFGLMQAGFSRKRAEYLAGELLATVAERVWDGS